MKSKENCFPGWLDVVQEDSTWTWDKENNKGFNNETKFCLRKFGNYPNCRGNILTKQVTFAGTWRNAIWQIKNSKKRGLVLIFSCKNEHFLIIRMIDSMNSLVNRHR